MLVGGDTGAYGIDLNLSFPFLLKQIISKTTINKLYIHDLNVRWIMHDLDQFIQVLSEDILCKVRILSIPIQSGSDKILKLMNRKYTSDDIVKIFSIIKNIRPDIRLSTHIIVGFPSEDENDFNTTISLLNNLPIDFISCFPYSEHIESKSFNLYPKIHPIVTNKRIKQLSELFPGKIKVYL